MSFLGTGDVSFFSSSRRAGEIVRKSQPAKALISPVYDKMVRTSHARLQTPAGSYVAERSTHNDGLVSVLLVVVVDLGDGLDARVFLVLIFAFRLGLVLLVPVQDAAHEWRNKSDASLSASNGLAEAEQEGEVAVDPVVTLKFTGGLDSFPGRGDFDENAFLLDADRLVKLDQVLGL